MAKLHFKYSAMNAGKTTILIQNAYNYEESGMKVIVIKPAKDTKGNNKIVSRLGIERVVDELIGEEDNIVIKLNKYYDNIDCIFVDEAQFLKSEQIDQLFYISKKYNIPVIAYGLRTDFKTNGFDGSARLLLLADDLEELPTICSCGKKARFSARMVNDKFVYDGESVLIDGSNNKIKYKSLCGECYTKNILMNYVNYEEKTNILTLKK